MKLIKIYPKELRVIGIYDRPFDKFRTGNVLVIGVVFIGGAST